MLYENVERLCTKKGISIWALESAIKVGNGTIGKWKTSSARVGTVKKVADHFGVTVDSLLADNNTTESVQ